jgi:hypothetical protein
MGPAATWDNGQLDELALAPGASTWRVYLPVMVKGQ